MERTVQHKYVKAREQMLTLLLKVQNYYAKGDHISGHFRNYVTTNKKNPKNTHTQERHQRNPISSFINGNNHAAS